MLMSIISASLILFGCTSTSVQDNTNHRYNVDEQINYSVSDTVVENTAITDSESENENESTDTLEEALVGTWSPDIYAAQPEIIEFFYDYTHDANGYLCYYHFYLSDNVDYLLSWGYVGESDNGDDCICYPGNYIPYTYFSFDSRQVVEGVLIDQLDGRSFYKTADTLLADPLNVSAYAQIDYSGCWPELQEYMEEWYGDNYTLISEGSRIWAHAYDSDFYEYTQGNYTGDAVYDYDHYRLMAQESSQLLYNCTSQPTVTDPRVIFIVSGDGNLDTTIFVFVNGRLIYDATTDETGLVNWG